MEQWEQFFKGKKVTVFGLGLHGGGVGTVRFLCKAGCKVTVTDIKTADQLRYSIEKLKSCGDINYVLGQNRPEDFERADMVVISPAIQWSNPYVKRAIASGVPVEMDSSLFCRFCPCPIVGVTGTKGKTTTSFLIYEILRRAGKNPLQVGIGQTSVLDKLLEAEKQSIAVFELSSWRLSALGRSRISPHVGVFTNFYPDHLNYYGSMEKYFEDKKEICRYQKSQDYFIANCDDIAIRRLSGEVPSKTVSFSFRDCKSPLAVFLEHSEIRLRASDGEDSVVNLSDIHLKGRHNVSNVMASVAAAWACGVPREVIGEAVSRFHGVPHRLEMVTEKRGVKYYNDTAATIPQAVLSALDSFTQPVILIAGGSDKGLEYGDFAKRVIEKAKDIILFEGKASDAMRTAIIENLRQQGIEKEIPSASSMEEAVRLARQRAQHGDIVLLSPGAASFGMFDNEFHRGEMFRSAVNTPE